MKRQTALFFYLLGAYVVLQFCWWGFHLIELTEASKTNPFEITKRVTMIIGEGLVFFLLLLFGLWKIRSSIIQELRLSQRQTNFLLSVTHELKTPIAANKLYLQTIQKRQLEASQQKELVHKAIQENERLEYLIDNILNASRLENNALKAIKTKKNLSEFALTIAQRFNKRHQNELISVQLTPDIEVPFDAFFIDTILTNLIENALKYAGKDAEITVYVLQQKEGVILGVKDNGPGIDKKVRNYIFNKFYRAGNEETRMQKGSGLGLFIVAELTRMHGAKITYLENKPTGANFEITLIA
jgi:signal transduction histidine kinase